MATLTLSLHVKSLKSDIERRLWILTAPEPNSGCWLWTGAVNPHGYAKIRIDGTDWLGHRLAYELFVGPIPRGLELDHKCRVRSCINPDHMEPVTGRENILRGESVSAQNARKTHCNHGHKFMPENTYVYPNGHRVCRACKRRIDRTRYAKQTSG